ncbi:aminotransferase [Purpureocillium lavendulum]|uniref:Aminotransferase n=1 Tax=Purpureocillium lavendulum TaxID=1247861 RepID=A0AB34FNL6_9HYPO|nr:aminotransferase [Purpureocillium lavendulum]
MCFHFMSWNACPVCSATFNRRRNLVPCWNGHIACSSSSSTSSPPSPSSSSSKSSSASSSALRRPKAAVSVLRHHGLRCRSGHYAESDAETYKDRPCDACAARIAWNNTRAIGRARRAAAAAAAAATATTTNTNANTNAITNTAAAAGQQQQQHQQRESELLGEEQVVELVTVGGGIGHAADRMPLGHIGLRLAHVDHVAPRVKTAYGAPQGGRRGRWGTAAGG